MERELLEATRRLDEAERQIQHDSRQIGKNMRIALASARTDIPPGLGESSVPPSWWAALGEPPTVEGS